MAFFHRKPAAPQWIIAGLGNPGQQYEYTRHNAGFLCLDVISSACRCKVDRLKFSALTELCELGGQRCVLMKPTTYMNKSGEAIAACARFYQIPPERILVIFDDVSLPAGSLRIRRGGSAGGHNGTKSIIERLGTQEFPRIKLGVGGPPHADYDMADWVLSSMSGNDLKNLRKKAEEALAAATLIVSGDIEQAMSKYSR